MGKTVRVRVIVLRDPETKAMSAAGYDGPTANFASWYQGKEGDDLLELIAGEMLDQHDVIGFMEADIPLPEPQTIAAEVVDPPEADG